MVNKTFLRAPPPGPAPRRAAAARTATRDDTRHGRRGARARPEASRVRSEMYSSRAMAEGQGGSPSTARPPPDACAGLAAAASAPRHRVARAGSPRPESQSESRDPATVPRPDPPGRTAAPGAAQDGRRPEHGDRREARTDMSVILSDRPKQPHLFVMIYVSARYSSFFYSKFHSTKYVSLR